MDMIYVLILRIEVNFFHNLSYWIICFGILIAGPEFKEVTIWPTADLNKLNTELKNDGYLHITVPITVRA
jgi:hypothetical protein